MEGTAAQSQSVWQHIPQGPPDAILGVSEAFKKDQSSQKINLGVGAYRTEEGKPLVLNVVKKAEQKIVNDPSENKEYLGITGNPVFNELSAKLAFGENSSVIREKRNATVQALSGTGSLRVGAEFLAQHYPVHTVLLPNPTWANHNKIFPLAGIKDVRKYRYFKPSTKGLDYEGMIEDMQSAPEGSVVVLHACAHNPTGVDPTLEQWRGILKTVQQKHLLPFFDSAYQGFASGDLERDAAAIRLFADAGLELLLAQSYAKNMGLYGERVGAMTVVTKSADVTSRVESQLKQVIRPMFSNPPRHGAAIVVEVLSDPRLYAEWREELKGMAGRIKSMRAQLLQALKDVGAPGTWDHVVNQIGMFSFLGVTKEQVRVMTEKHHVYLTQDGRISMAGLSASKCRYLAEAINDAVRNA
ncbi:g3330 [Coccomyxa viridis]|uniref:Aspartate aminotransferase n=1 Tax=Coccomyxa viridis TaxID=1274662 RepID=A0ABP1FMI9_9CHLO